MQPSQNAGDIAQIMQAYAEDAVRAARQHHVNLDYSEQSLEEVEGLLGQLHDQLQKGPPAGVLSSSQAAQDPLDEMSRIWGGYLGEVVRRRFGGEWAIEKYPAGDFLIVTLNVNGARLFPAMKVYKRLTDGADEDLREFYRKVRIRLEAQPGGNIQ